jgi:endonuclease/exonuclease/phosphatase (EEP) superfamily protein YafD
VIEVIGRQPGYTLVHDGFACVLSRHPVLASQRVPESLADPVREAGVSRARRVLRVDVVVDERPVTLYAVHLESPRDALFAARHFDGSRLQDNAERRSLNSRAASQFVDRSAPGLLVLGDFNLTVESALFRRDWGDLVNAFSVAGRGFGHTMFAGRHRVRIDHVLAGPAWRPIRAVVESGFPSEHQPVVVEFARGEGR